jgi:hypothetical protein
MAVFWLVEPCSLVEVFRLFIGARCLHHQGSLKMEAASTTETSVHFYQATRRNTLAAVRTWNLTEYLVLPTVSSRLIPRSEVHYDKWMQQGAVCRSNGTTYGTSCCTTYSLFMNDIFYVCILLHTAHSHMVLIHLLITRVCIAGCLCPLSW